MAQLFLAAFPEKQGLSSLHSSEGPPATAHPWHLRLWAGLVAPERFNDVTGEGKPMELRHEHPMGPSPSSDAQRAAHFSQYFCCRLHPGTHPGLPSREREQTGTRNATTVTLDEATHIYVAKMLPCKTCCSVRFCLWKRSERVSEVRTWLFGFAGLMFARAGFSSLAS